MGLKLHTIKGFRHTSDAGRFALGIEQKLDGAQAAGLCQAPAAKPSAPSPKAR